MSRIVAVRPASASALAEGGRFAQAQYPLGETPSVRHIVVTGELVLSRSTNRYTITGSRRSPWRRRPRLFSGSPAPSGGSGSRAGGGPARLARRSSDRPPHPRPPRLGGRTRGGPP